MSKTQRKTFYLALLVMVILFNGCSDSSDGGTGSGGGTNYIDAPIKQTGQTASYDENGIQINDNSLKDDGYYKEGLEPKYTRSSDIVTDELTGLMWQDDVNVTTNDKQWLTTVNFDECDNDESSPACYDTSGDTAATYCSELKLGGYSDWRLPTIEELTNIADYSHGDPFIDPAFDYTTESYYWSSTTGYSDDNDTARYFRFNDAYNGSDDKSYDFNVRCVRAQ